jgi:hypothetical protein
MKPQQALLLWHAPKNIVETSIYNALTKECLENTLYEPESELDFSIKKSAQGFNEQEEEEKKSIL